MQSTFSDNSGMFLVDNSFECFQFVDSGVKIVDFRDELLIEGNHAIGKIDDFGLVFFVGSP